MALRQENMSLPDTFYEDLKSFLDPVVLDVSPDEAQAFSNLPAGVLRYAASSKGESALTGSRYEFSDALAWGTLLAHLLAGTLAVIHLWLSFRERREHEEFERSVQREWRKALIKAGVPSKLADEIPVKYAPEFIAFLAQHRLPQI